MFIAYLLDNDTVAYGIGDFGIGKTREEAIANLRAKWEAAPGTADEPWDEAVENGEALTGWGTEKMRLFCAEVTE